MKFTWFHLMPWPHMPEDFRQKHRSVWVDLPSRMYEPELGHIAYHQYLDQLEYAEKVGFDGIGVNEHHANAYGLMPSPNLMAAALAEHLFVLWHLKAPRMDRETVERLPHKLVANLSRLETHTLKGLAHD